MRSRPISTASSASQPNAWLRLGALPNLVVKYGIISSRTRGSTGVVEWLSMKMGSLRAMGIVFLSVRSVPEHELGDVRFLVVQIAALARGDEPLRIADVAGIEVLQAGGEL